MVTCETIEEVEDLATVSVERAVPQMDITVGGHSTSPKQLLKYLGVTVDNCSSFGAHVKYCYDSASKVIDSLAWIMSNCHGPKSSKRRRYGGAAWSSAIEVERNRSKLQSTHRLIAMRISCAYRIISTDAALDIAGMVPIDITLAKDKECYVARAVRGVLKAQQAASNQEELEKEKGKTVDDEHSLPLVKVKVKPRHTKSKVVLVGRTLSRQQTHPAVVV
ncbi:uncharacterized protein LOC129758596 [Uranotaenia lowii]|uniref:uncharacterized protein LOC129758596 n=1 Tax=Uranotaenia lowii TaxID=190385 RepID=UPI00247A146C|nr:uncharacterized protein LOC129758596 [Uranotaenia lowii]